MYKLRTIIDCTNKVQINKINTIVLLKKMVTQKLIIGHTSKIIHRRHNTAQFLDGTEFAWEQLHCAITHFCFECVSITIHNVGYHIIDYHRLVPRPAVTFKLAKALFGKHVKIVFRNRGRQ